MPEEISLDVLMLRDKQYFIDHPHCDRYIREYVPGELLNYPPGVVLFDKDGSEIKYTLVIKLLGNPGARARRPISEHTYERMINYQSRVAQRQEQKGEIWNG